MYKFYFYSFFLTSKIKIGKTERENKNIYKMSNSVFKNVAVSLVTGVRWYENDIPEFALESIFCDGHSKVEWKSAREIPIQTALYCRKYIAMHEDNSEFQPIVDKLMEVFIAIHRREFEHRCLNPAEFDAIPTMKRFDNAEIITSGTLDSIILDFANKYYEGLDDFREHVARDPISISRSTSNNGPNFPPLYHQPNIYSRLGTTIPPRFTSNNLHVDEQTRRGGDL